MSTENSTPGLTVLVLGASGMVGQGVLRECLRDERITDVHAVVRRALHITHPKLRVVVTDDVTSPGDHLTGLDATFDAIGVSSTGMSESDYRRLTHELTGASPAPSPAGVPARRSSTCPAPAPAATAA